MFTASPAREGVSSNPVVDSHGDQLLGTTLDVSVDRRLQNSPEKESEQSHVNDEHPTNNKSNVDSLEGQHTWNGSRPSIELVILEAPDADIIHLRACGDSYENMARTWWNRHFRSPHPRSQNQNFDIFSNSAHPICPCSGCASPRDSLGSSKNVIPSMSSDRRDIDIVRQRLKSLNVTNWFRRCSHWRETSEMIPLNAERLHRLSIRDVNLDIERTQIINELAMTQDLLTYVANTISRVQPHHPLRVNLIREYKRLKDQETSVIDHLQDIEHEMEDIGGVEDPQMYEFADFSHESIIPLDVSQTQDGDPEASFMQSFVDTRYGYIELSRIAEAMAELNLYNKKWNEVQRSTSDPISSQITRLVPWPTKSPFFTPEAWKSICQSLLDETNENHVWKLLSYKFFCAPFGLVTLVSKDQECSDMFAFALPEKTTPADDVASLKGLKEQLKLEKTRWHEDKLRALFGKEAAVDERAKAIWSAVMDLKAKVDVALEDLDQQ